MTVSLQVHFTFFMDTVDDLWQTVHQLAALGHSLLSAFAGQETHSFFFRRFIELNGSHKFKPIPVGSRNVNLCALCAVVFSFGWAMSEYFKVQARKFRPRRGPWLPS